MAFSKERFRCKQCNEYWFNCFTIHDELWLSLPTVGPRGWYCMPCVEKDLGRPLTIDDFDQSPCNDLLRIGYAMAEEDSRTGR